MILVSDEVSERVSVMSERTGKSDVLFCDSVHTAYCCTFCDGIFIVSHQNSYPVSGTSSQHTSPAFLKKL